MLDIELRFTCEYYNFVKLQSFRNKIVVKKTNFNTKITEIEKEIQLVAEIINKINLGTKISDAANSFADRTKFNDVVNELKSNKEALK